MSRGQKKEFLRTFEKHSELNDYQVWLDWLNTIKANMVRSRMELRMNLEEGGMRVDEYRRRLIALEDPKLVNLAQFDNFLRTK